MAKAEGQLVAFCTWCMVACARAAWGGDLPDQTGIEAGGDGRWTGLRQCRLQGI